MSRLLAVIALLWPFASGHAQQIVDRAFVADAAKRGAIVWDVRDAAAYRQGHIPGAVNVDDVARVLRDANTEDFLPTPQIEAVLGGAGIDPAQEIVIYATRGNPNAYFALYTVRYFGGTKASVYHDGIDDWRESGAAVETADTKRPAVALKLTATPGIAASTSEVLERVRSGKTQLLDVRTAGEYAGTDVRAIRGGHLPGAVNIPYEHNWLDPDTGAKMSKRQVADNKGMSLKSDSELRTLYKGLDAEKETIVYCQSGVRAAETATVLSRLGFRNVKIYDSSWLGYSAKLDAPAENETFFNVGAMKAQLAGMQARIAALEKELAETRAAAHK